MNKLDIIRDTKRRIGQQNKQIKSKGLSYQIPKMPELTNEEINAINIELFKEYAIDKEKIEQGLMKKSDSVARQTLINNNMRLVPFILNKYDLLSYRPEDMMQTGAIGLIKAIDSYDVNFGVTPSSYISVSVVRCVKREMYAYDKFQIHKGVCLSLDSDDILNSSSDDLSFINMIPSEMNVEEIVLSKLEPNVDKYSVPVSRAIDMLPKYEQYVVRTIQHNFEAMETGEDCVSMRELSTALNLSYQRIFQLRDKAFDFIRVFLTKEDMRSDEDKKLYDSIIRKRNREIAKDIQQYLSESHEKPNKYDAMKVDDSDVDYEKLAKHTAKRKSTFAEGVQKNIMNYLKLKKSGAISNATEYTPMDALTDSDVHDDTKIEDIHNDTENQTDANANKNNDKPHTKEYEIIARAKGDRYANKHCCFALEDLEK